MTLKLTFAIDVINPLIFGPKKVVENIRYWLLAIQRAILELLVSMSIHITSRVNCVITPLQCMSSVFASLYGINVGIEWVDEFNKN